MKTFEADKLAARFGGLLEANQALIKEEYLRRLFEALLGDVMHHEPGTAFGLGGKGGGLDEVIAWRQAGAVGKFDLAHGAALIFERAVDDVGDLVVLEFFDERAATVDAGLLEKVSEGAVDELDAHLVIDDGVGVGFGVGVGPLPMSPGCFSSSAQVRSPATPSGFRCAFTWNASIDLLVASGVSPPRKLWTPSLYLT